MAYIERIVMNTELPITIPAGQFHKVVRGKEQAYIEIRSRRAEGFECYDKPTTYRCYSGAVVCVMVRAA